MNGSFLHPCMSHPPSIETSHTHGSVRHGDRSAPGSREGPHRMNGAAPLPIADRHGAGSAGTRPAPRLAAAAHWAVTVPQRCRTMSRRFPAARVAEQADAPVSKTGDGNIVRVRSPPRAPRFTCGPSTNSSLWTVACRNPAHRRAPRSPHGLAGRDSDARWTAPRRVLTNQRVLRNRYLSLRGAMKGSCSAPSRGVIDAARATVGAAARRRGP
jgi:hypothetical protein